MPPPARPRIVCAGMLDTKGPEIRHLAEMVAASGGEPIVMDLSLGAMVDWADVSLPEVLATTDTGLEDVFAAPRADAIELVGRAGARKILEIGALAGYSGIWLARALPSDGQLISVEVSEKHAAVARASLERAGVADRAGRGDEAQKALLRVALPAAKYWVCKRASAHAAEALECLGGNGYVEESGMPRLYREAPLNSIWEGAGNVTALDVLRALARTPAAASALLAELDLAAGGDRRLDAAVAGLRDLLAGLEAATTLEAQHGARRLAGLIAVTLQGALLVRHAPGPVADAFCATRLGTTGPGGPGAPYGMLPDGLDLAAILERARVLSPG